jgi:tetratricopeptide (TPR) repeat protein
MDEMALAQLRQAMQTRPEDGKVRLDLLKALVESGCWQEAVEVGVPLTQLPTPPAEIYQPLTIVYGKLMQWDAAVQQGRQALDQQPDDVLTWFNLGTALSQQNDHDAALEALDKAIEQQEDWAEMHYNRGTVLLRLERYADALDAFERATELRENYAEAHFSCGNVHAMKGLEADGGLDYYEIDCAITAYKRAIQHRSGYTAALYNLGMLYGRMGSHEGLRVWDQYLEAAHDLPEEETWRMRAQEYRHDLQDRLR